MTTEHPPTATATAISTDEHVHPAPAHPMRAVVQDAYGSVDVLRVELISPPEPVGEHDVLVRVRAAGLSRGTWHIMTGRPYLLRLVLGLRRPRNRVVGDDVAGTVVAVGSAVTRFTPGDEVFGIARGALAEYALASEDRLARKPANASFEQSAVVPVSALTALQALRDVGGVQAGQRVLVIGASGGVGTFAVQLAAAFGAQVTGVCSTGKVDLVRALGAQRVVDYTGEDFAAGSDRYDLILDIGGNASLARLRHALTPAGTAVIVGGEEAGRWTGLRRQVRARAVSPFVGQRLTSVLCKQRGSDLERLAELIEAGAVTPSVDRTYPLDQVGDAMLRLESGQARGKIAITV